MKLTSKMIAILVNDIMVSKKENVRRVIIELLEEENEGYGDDNHLLNLLLGDASFKELKQFIVEVLKENMSQIFHSPENVIKDSLRINRIDNIHERIAIGYKQEGSNYEYTCYINFSDYELMCVKKD
jgi:hypothetical protein